MLHKIIDYLSTRGMTLMMIGFILLAGSLMVYMQTPKTGSPIRQVAFVCTIIGVAVYITGRVFVAVNRQNSRKKKSVPASSEDEL